MIEFVKVEGRHVADIKILTLSTCGWCKKTKGFLNDNGIEYFYLDVDLLPSEEAKQVSIDYRQYSPNWSFPTVIVDDSRAIVGYNLKALKELIEK